MAAPAKLWKIRRIYLDRVGSPAARFRDVWIDLTGRDGAPLDTILWMRNGGGKSTLIALVCALIRPDRRDFLATATTGRHLEDCVLGADTAHVVVEWTDPSGQRLVTGAAYEWTDRVQPGDPNTAHDRLRQSWYAFTPGSFDIEDLPFTGLGGVPTDLRDFIKAVESLPPDAEPVVTGKQERWTQALQDRGLDPGLFTAILRINATEGGIEHHFKFKTSDDFVQYLLSLVTEPTSAGKVAAILRGTRDRLARQPRLRAEVAFCDEAVSLLADLTRTRDALASATTAAAAERETASRLAAALVAAAALAYSEADASAGEVAAHYDAASAAAARTKDLDQDIKVYRYRGATLYHHGTVAAASAAERTVRERRHQHRAWQLVPVLTQRVEQTQRLEVARAQQQEAEAGAAPLRRNRADAAATLLAVLRQACAELEARVVAQSSEAATALQTQQSARASADAVRGQLGSLESQERSYSEQLAGYDRALAAAWPGVEASSGAGVSATASSGAGVSATASSGADLFAAYAEAQRADAAASEELDVALPALERQLAADRTGHEAARAALQSELTSLSRDKAVLDAARTPLLADIEELSRDPRLTTLTERDTVDPITDHRLLVDLLTEAVITADRLRIQLSVADAEDDRAVQALASTRGLLPAALDLARAADVLAAAHIPATTGWHHLADAVPPSSWATVVAEAPHLVGGLLLRDPVDLNRARAALREAGLYPTSAVQVSTVDAIAGVASTASSSPTLTSDSSASASWRKSASASLPDPASLAASASLPDPASLPASASLLASAGGGPAQVVGGTAGFVVPPAPAMYDRTAAAAEADRRTAGRRDRELRIQELADTRDDDLRLKTRLQELADRCPPGHREHLDAEHDRLTAHLTRNTTLVAELDVARAALDTRLVALNEDRRRIAEQRRLLATRLGVLADLVRRAPEAERMREELAEIPREREALGERLEEAEERERTAAAAAHRLAADAERDREKGREYSARCDDLARTAGESTPAQGTAGLSGTPDSSGSGSLSGAATQPGVVALPSLTVVALPSLTVAMNAFQAADDAYTKQTSGSVLEATIHEIGNRLVDLDEQARQFTTEEHATASALLDTIGAADTSAVRRATEQADQDHLAALSDATLAEAARKAAARELEDRVKSLPAGFNAAREAAVRGSAASVTGFDAAREAAVRGSAVSVAGLDSAAEDAVSVEADPEVLADRAQVELEECLRAEQDARRRAALAEAATADAKRRAGDLTELATDLTDDEAVTPVVGQPAFEGDTDAARDATRASRKSLQGAERAVSTARNQLAAETHRIDRWASEERFAAVSPEVRERFRGEGLAPEAERLTEQLTTYRHSLAGELEAVDKDKHLVVTALCAEVREGLKTLQRAQHHAQIPMGLAEHLRSRRFLDVGPRASVDTSDATVRSRVERLVDRLVSRPDAIPDGLALTWEATSAVVGRGNFVARVLKPSTELGEDRQPVELMSKWSGGEKVTISLLLFCMLARLRAANRGGDVPGLGVLPMDNPLGTANYVTFLDLQRRVAAANGIQLIFLSGLGDMRAVGRFPNVVRMRNTHNRGRNYARVMERELNEDQILESITTARLTFPVQETLL